MDNKALHDVYQEYWASCAGADRALWYQSMEYEDLFNDMTFQADSILSEYIRYQEQCEDGEWLDGHDDYYLGLDDNHVRFYVEDLPEDECGRFYLEERKIVISSKYTEDKSALLHEMIHAHEHIVNEGTYMFLHDILVLCLYNDLKAKIPDLDSRLIDHTHVIHGQRITWQGGQHDILFFLKSLDLDLRCGFKLGTVCGYGRDDFKQRDTGGE